MAVWSIPATHPTTVPHSSRITVVAKPLESHSLRSTDTDTATEIRHGETRGHGKFQKTRIQIRQGHGIIR